MVGRDPSFPFTCRDERLGSNGEEVRRHVVTFVYIQTGEERYTKYSNQKFTCTLLLGPSLMYALSGGSERYISTADTNDTRLLPR